MVLLKLCGNAIIKKGAIISTFHYGSIKISFYDNIIHKIKKSTFHYGSIKMINF